jgi:hypothetical protein
VGFVVDKVSLRQVFTEYFDLLCQFSLHQRLYFSIIRVVTVDPILADIPSGLSPTPSYD